MTPSLNDSLRWRTVRSFDLRANPVSGLVQTTTNRPSRTVPQSDHRQSKVRIEHVPVAQVVWVRIVEM